VGTLKNIVQLLEGNPGILKRNPDVLKRSPDTFQAVLNHTQRLEALNRTLRGCIPAPLNQHCQVANLRDNILILHADSSAWALKLRYSSRVLLQQLRQRGVPGLNAIEVKVRPHNAAIRRPEKIRHAHMSGKTAQLLDSIASDISDDRLKVALQRLARHGKDTNPR